MAKDREGSVNIYGAMQAKTAQGIVAYTDGIAHENEDGSVINLDEMLKNGVGGVSAIVDVEELVYPGWSGTTVPISGTVEKVYFNTSLSIDEVVNILKQLTYDSNGYYNVFSNSDGSVNLTVLDNYSLILNSNIVLFSVDEGWSNFENPYDFNFENVLGFYGLATQNSQLSSLFSTTPFVKSEEPKDDVFYRVDVGGGTVVPNNGYVDKVYFNTKLSVEETFNILKNLTNIHPSDDFYIILKSGTLRLWGFAIEEEGNTGALINDTYNNFYFAFLNDEQASIQQFGFYGWNPNFYGVLELNSELSSSHVIVEGSEEKENYVVGSQNDLIKNLISITPFPGRNIIYSYKDGIYNRILDENNLNIEEKVLSFKYKSYNSNTETITLTQKQYDILKNNKDYKIRLEMWDDYSRDFIVLPNKYIFDFTDNENTVILYFYGFINLSGSDEIKQLVTAKITSDLNMTLSFMNINEPNVSLSRFEVSSNGNILIGLSVNGGEHILTISQDTIPTSGSVNPITSGAVYTALQDYPKTSEVNQMIADYITTNFENGDEGSY